MKRSLFLVLVGCLAGSLSACSSQSQGHGPSGVAGAGGTSPDSGASGAGGAAGDGAGGAGGAAGAGGTAPKCFWHRVAAPAGTGYLDIDGSGPGDVWAVGNDGLASHYDGSSWKRVPVSGSETLEYVAVPAHGTVWAATSLPATVFKWNGAMLATQPDDFAVTSVYALWANAPDNVWLGTQWNFGAGPTYRYDGTKWMHISASTQDGFGPFWGSGPNDMWASVGAGALYHYDGSSWSMNAPNAGSAALWGSAADDIWSVGSQVLHFDGTGWKKAKFQSTGLTTISGTASNEVWATGPKSDIFHFNGSSWSPIGDPDAPYGADTIYAASPTALYLISDGDIYFSTSSDCATSDKCSNLCVDKQNDPAYCGSCGNSCGSAACVHGQCTCSGSQTFCVDQCVDTQVDPQNCGSCSNACPSVQTCAAGACVCPTSGTTLCGNTCVDTQTDPQHCGSCGKACPAGATCTAGACKCPAGTTLCGNACTDTSSDTSSCGGCGHVCGNGFSCSSGTCTCLAPRIMCGGKCVDPRTDPQNCGACGNVCNVACQGSSCVTVSEVAAGTDSTCARLSDGSVRCWGRKGNGTSETTPTDTGLTGVTALDAGGDENDPNTETMCAVTGGGVACAETLLGSPAFVPTLDNAVSVSIGTGYSSDFRCSLRSDASVGCWGDNPVDGLGDGSLWQGQGTTSSATPVTPLGLPSAQEVSVGGFGACALASGQVWCWGWDSANYGNLDTTIPSVLVDSGVVDIAVGDALSFVKSDGTVWQLWDSGSYKSQVAGIANAVKVAVYSWNGCALLTDKTVSCWDSYGNVTPISGLTNVTQVSVGYEHACAITQDGQAYCWGTNSDGQLGTGNTTDSATPVAPAW